ncbi:hypothetical protein N3K63_13315 [Microbacterium sp. W1N]|uniref:DUF7882 family protein n=1 Tax=Microbacterium festucae TaxID=2977531 RepID=UPI0021BF26E3|nr:hypothetical protein [Microbacterium festucae]MCT9821258.1 hypothetical protein [Microbacterium festucae]
MPDPIELPDRILAHLKVVISTKLRRSESFSLSWERSSSLDGERSTLWLHCAIPLRFEVSSEAAGAIDRAYLNELAKAANSSGGIVVDLDTADACDIAAPAALVRAA